MLWKLVRKGNEGEACLVNTATVATVNFLPLLPAKTAFWLGFFIAVNNDK
jgi:hypothetical protein